MKHRRLRNRLKVLRAEHAVTQIDLSRKVGISRDRYWYIENGYKAPTETERRRLAKALRVEESALGFDQVMERAAS